MAENTYDQVNTANLLEELRRDTEESSAQVLTGPVGEELAHLESATTALDLERLLDVLHFDVDLFGVDIGTGQAGKDIARFLRPASHEQPTRRIRKIQQGPHDQQSKERLEHDRKSPANTAVGPARRDEVEAIVDPVSDHDTEHDRCTGSDNVSSSILWFRAFGLPCGNSWNYISASSNDPTQFRQDLLDVTMPLPMPPIIRPAIRVP